MLINFDKHLKKLNDIRAGKVSEGLRLGVDRLDNHFRLVYGNLNFILGHANTGKTHLVFYLMFLYSLKHNVRWLVFSSENEPYALIRKLIEFAEGKPINQIETEDFKKQYDWVYNHFKFVDTEKAYTYKDLLELATSIKKAWDYQGFLIDPLNSLKKNIPKNSNSYEYSYESLTDIRIFCKQHNITTWICVHAVTEALRKKHPQGHYYANQPIPPMASDSEMGGMSMNRADDFLVIHRYIYHETDWIYSNLYTAKVKNQELNYKPTPIDDPVKFRSILNNVGFEIDGKNLVTYNTKEQTDLPF
tara:strand:+ start:316 stop:1224 length:909 start_codon:yes stop_codon:yes gene_type:complete